MPNTEQAPQAASPAGSRAHQVVVPTNLVADAHLTPFGRPGAPNTMTDACGLRWTPPSEHGASRETKCVGLADRAAILMRSRRNH